jgi:Flp pilus assembly protein TadG
MRTIRRSQRKRRGAAAVELAVVSPLLVLFILGIIEMGQAISVRQALLDTARGACRLATLEGSTNEKVLAEISKAMAVAGISAFEPKISPTPLSSASKGQYVTVEISTDFSEISWLPLPKHFAGATLRGACSLPHE